MIIHIGSYLYQAYKYGLETQESSESKIESKNSLLVDEDSSDMSDSDTSSITNTAVNVLDSCNTTAQHCYNFIDTFCKELLPVS